MKADEFLDSPTIDEFLDSPVEGTTSITPESVGRQGVSYLQDKYPRFAKAILGNTFWGTPEFVNTLIIDSIGKGEEVMLKGGNPVIAEVEAMRNFMDKADPF